MDKRIVVMATAIANSIGNRRGMPSITNVLDFLPQDLRNNIIEDAEAALKALGAQPEQAHNSDYAAALRVVKEYKSYLKGRSGLASFSFDLWLDQRLNA